MIKVIIYFLLVCVFFIPGGSAITYESIKADGGGFITNIVVDPNNSSIVYALSDLGGAYKSYDKGDEWTPISFGLVTDADYAACTIVVSPSNSSVLYMGVGKDDFPCYNNRCGSLWKSIDGGDIWIKSTDTFGFGAVIPNNLDVAGDQIVVHPDDEDIVYAGSYNQGVYKTTNGGDDWTYKGLTGFLISGVKMDQNNSEILYVSMSDMGAPSPKVSKSINGGDSFLTISTRDAYDIEIDSQVNTTIYMAAYDEGVFKSINGGTDWTDISPPFSPDGGDGECPSVILYSDVEESGGELYVKSKCRNREFHSDDQGASWTQTPTSTAYLYVGDWHKTSTNFGVSLGDFEVDPSDGTTAYLGTWHAIWRTNDTGASWYVRSNGLETTPSQEIAVDPHSGDLYTASADIGLFRSQDNNTGNEIFRMTDVDDQCWSVEIGSNQDPSWIFAGTGSWSGSTKNGHVFKSTDRGENWIEYGTGNGLADSRVRSIAIDPNNNNIVYSGHSNSDVYRTSNGGTSWSSVSTGLPAELAWYGDVLSLAINPDDTTEIYAGIQGRGLYNTTNSGGSWSLLSGVASGLPATKDASSEWDVAVDPNNGDIVYVVTEEYGVYRSTNAGSSWTNVKSSYDGVSVAIDSNSIVYVGGKSEWAGGRTPGLYSSPNGTSFERVDNGRLNLAIDDIEINPLDEPMLYIGTRGMGTWRVDLLPPDDPPTWTKEPNTIYLDRLCTFSSDGSMNCENVVESDTQIPGFNLVIS